MKTCAKCNLEYDEREENCPKCDLHLQEKHDLEKEWLILTTVANDIEFSMVAGILEMGNIPVIRNVRGVDGFIQVVLGVPLAGIDILVPTDKFEEAYGLLNSPIEDENLEDEKPY